MGQARRSQAHLRVAKALADFAQNIAGRHAQVLELNHTVAAGKTGVHGIHLPHDPDAGTIHVRQEHGGRAILHACHDDDVARTLGAGDEPLGAVDHVVVAILHRRGHQHRRVGTGTGCWLGHGKAGARPALDLRAQPALLLRFGRHRVHQVDIAFVGRVHVDRRGTQRGISGLLEHHRLGHVAQRHAAHLPGAVRRQQACGAGLGDEFPAQLRGRAMGCAAWVAFKRDHILRDEVPRALLQIEQVLR